MYGSDVSREQFERVRPLLEGVRRRTSRERSIYTRCFAVCCICSRAVASDGCCRASSPSGARSIRISEVERAGPDGISLLERALKKSVGEDRARQGRNATTGLLIVDAQSVKNTDTARSPTQKIVNRL